MQADGDGPGDYMHSGIRGGPHAGAFRRCSFTETELELQRKSTSNSRSSPASLAMTDRPYGVPVSVLPAIASRVSRDRTGKPHTFTDSVDQGLA